MKKKKIIPSLPIVSKNEVSSQDCSSVKKNDNNGTSNPDDERIVDRLELQLLITVIVFFVSGWAFLNNAICSFTESANHNEVINYILVHYVLSVVLFLCIYITYLKGEYIVNNKSINKSKDKYFKLFMDSWFFSLILSLGIIWFSSYIPWWLCCIILVVLVYRELRALQFEKLKIRTLLVWVICCFPLFISTMTLLNKNIDVQIDKEYYTIDDDILISVNSQGYACSHRLVCLGEEELYPNTNYIKEKNIIVLNATTIRNNEISIGTVSPASGLPNFFEYPFKKMFNHETEYIDTKKDSNKKFINYKSKSISIRP